MGRYPEQSPAQLSAGNGPFLTPDLNQIYHHYYSRLLAVATTRYRWVGLGPWVDPMRVEWLLVTKGIAAFTYVKQKEPLAEVDSLLAIDSERPGSKRIESDRFTITQTAVTGFLDDTYTPAGYQTYAPNGAGGIHFRTTLPLPEWKGVPIWGDANRSMYDANTIALFAKRLASASIVVDTNLRMTMRGAVLATTQDNLLSSQIMLEGAMRGIDTFVVDPADFETLKAIDFGVHPDTVERSHIIAMRLWSEALEALGVESPAPEKQERMLVDEVNGDHSQIAAIRRLTLTPRRRAADLINRRYFSGQPVVEVIDQW